ncbi:MAG: transglutaminase, partial [Azorhizobium sp. 12-66-6]
MRVRIYHQIIHKLEPGLRIATATIKLTPRNHEGQHIMRWPLDVQPDCRLYPHEDAFGNLK